MCSKMVHIFYQSVIVFFVSICWDSSIRASDTKKLDKLIKKAGSVLGTALEPLELVVERRMNRNTVIHKTSQSFIYISREGYLKT